MSKVILTSPIFDKAKRGRAFSNFISKQAKDFKVLTKERMVRGPQTGRLYARKRGANFRRSHRASARGQRPAVQTGLLLNAVSDRRISDTHSQVYIAEKVSSGGTTTTKYAEILQTKRGRPIMDKLDARQAEVKMRKEGDVLVKSLV
jgi:hypothetical protein